MLKLKPGMNGNRGERNWTNMNESPRDGFCDQAQLRDIEILADQDTHSSALRFWEVYVEGKPLKAGEAPDKIVYPHRPEYYIQQYGDKEIYARCIAGFNVRAFVTPDGKWHEAGKLGWCGFGDAIRESRRAFAKELSETIAAADPNLWMSIVDCHI